LHQFVPKHLDALALPGACVGLHRWQGPFEPSQLPLDGLGRFPSERCE
jgi:hypothetical protein